CWKTSRARCLTPNSSSPSIKTISGRREGGAEEAGLRLVFAAIFVDALQDFGHVFHLFEKGTGDVDRPLLGGGNGQAVARARIDLDQFAAEFILLLENDARVVGGIFEFGDDDALDGDVESLKHAA